MASWFSKWRFGKGRRTWGRKQSVFLRIQVRAGSQTKGLERGWKRRVRLRRDAITTLTPRFTNFFTDFEEKNRLFCSLWRSRVPQQYLLSDLVVRSCAEQTNLRFGEPTPDAKKRIKGSMSMVEKNSVTITFSIFRYVYKLTAEYTFVHSAHDRGNCSQSSEWFRNKNLACERTSPL